MLLKIKVCKKKGAPGPYTTALAESACNALRDVAVSQDLKNSFTENGHTTPVCHQSNPWRYFELI
jgi:hypothetical protein